MLPPELEQAIEQDHEALNALVQGDPSLKRKLYSTSDDVTLANPIAPPVRGWEQVIKTLERDVPNLREGEPLSFERISAYVAGDLAYVFEIERWRGKAGSSEELVSIELRVTQVFRREDGKWKIAHRHADPITTRRPIESIVRH